MAFDVIIVGGGIVGCTCAYYLTKAGQKVALIERASIGSGTTGNSFAWVNATSKVSDEKYHRLNALGHAMHARLAVEFGEQTLGVTPSGALIVVTRSDAAGYAAAKEQARLLSTYDYPSAWIGTRELRALEPHVAFPDDAEAIYSMSDPYLDAPRFARAMADAAQQAGGTVLENCTAGDLQATDDGVVTGIMTGQGLMEAPNVLVATGPDTPQTLSAITGYDGYSARFPMRRVPGLLVTTPSMAPRTMVRHVLYMSIGPEFHALTTPGGGLKIGSDETDGLIAEDQSPENLRRAAGKLLKRAKDIIPGFAGEACLDECTLDVGIRAYPEDGMSLAGPMPGAQGLYVIATHSGISLAPAVASLITQAIMTGEMPDQLQPFSLERFQAFA